MKDVPSDAIPFFFFLDQTLVLPHDSVGTGRCFPKDGAVVNPGLLSFAEHSTGFLWPPSMLLTLDCCLLLDNAQAFCGLKELLSLVVATDEVTF